MSGHRFGRRIPLMPPKSVLKNGFAKTMILDVIQRDLRKSPETRMLWLSYDLEKWDWSGERVKPLPGAIVRLENGRTVTVI